MTDIEEYIKELEEQGIIDENGYPLKCRDCGTSDFNEREWYEWYVVVEREVTCKSCGKIVGSWQYGRWEIV